MSWVNPHPNRSLHIEDYTGKPIENNIDADPSEEAIARSERSISPNRFIEKLVPPTGRYNCHGLVFANRRTNLGGPNSPIDLDDLLQRDRYRRIDARFRPQLGDIVIYRHESTGGIEHSGIVSFIDKIGKEAIVRVWSKWGALGEYEHQVNSCIESDYCNIEYWRLFA